MAHVPAEGNSKFDVHYFGFQIREKSSLDSMERLFEAIKMKVWPDKQANPLVHRTKFGVGLKMLNLWAAKFDPAPVQGLAGVFQEFTSEQAQALRAMSIRFSSIELRSVRGRMNVCLKPDPESLEALQKLQTTLIAKFKRFHHSGFEEVYDLSCSLMSLTTSKFTFEEFKSFVQQYNREFTNFEVRLELLIVSRSYEILLQFPVPTVEPCEDDTTDWISKSLCLLGVHCKSDEDAREIFDSLANLMEFKLHDDMLESCSWNTDYYGTSRIVAVFASAPSRDSFFREYQRYLARNDWRLRAATLIKGGSENQPILVFKAITRTKDSLIDKAQDLCWKRLRTSYQPRIDPITLDIFLKEREKPNRLHYFEDCGDLGNLVALLEKGSTTENLSVW